MCQSKNLYETVMFVNLTTSASYLLLKHKHKVRRPGQNVQKTCSCQNSKQMSEYHVL